MKMLVAKMFKAKLPGTCCNNQKCNIYLVEQGNLSELAQDKEAAQATEIKGDTTLLTLPSL